MIFRKQYILLLLSLLISCIYILPQMWFRQPNLLDIAETWGFGTDVYTSVVQEFIHEDRFRPVYAFQRSFQNYIFGYFSPMYFLFYAVVLACSIYMSLLIINQKHKSWGSLLVISFLFLISPITIDTYWRLGTAENMFVFILLIVLYLIIHMRYTAVTIACVFLMASKETAIWYLPIFIWVLWVKGRYKEFGILGFIYLLYLGKIYNLIVYANEHRDSYTALFSVSLFSVVDMFFYYVREYLFYFAIFGISIILFLYRKWKMGSMIRRKDVEVSNILVACVLAGLCSLLFFYNKHQPYYVFPCMVTILLFLGYELSFISKKLNILAIIYIGVLFFISSTFQNTMLRAYYWHNDYAADGVLIEKIIHSDPGQPFTFYLPNRPELSMALDILFGRHGYDQKDVPMNYIYSINNREMPASNILLCGRTIIQTKSCKWSVTSETIDEQ